MIVNAVAKASGALSILADHATQIDLPAMAGELGSAYAIPIIYVPILMITHVLALYWLARSAVAAPAPTARTAAL